MSSPTTLHQAELDFCLPHLYAREDELDELKQVYEQSKEHGSRQIVWISGYSGTGKSSLAQHAFQGFENFCCGNFVCVRSTLPFAELIGMVEHLCPILKNYQQIRMEEDEADVLIRLVPQLREVILFNKEDRTAAVSRTDWAYEKLKQAFRSLIKKIGMILPLPLVMFFDDLQWADPDSFGIIGSLVEDEEIDNVVFVASYRDNEVEDTSPLAACVRKNMDSSREDTTCILVSNLKAESLDSLVADLLRMDVSRVSPLSELIFTKTQGNVFYALRILKHIYAKELLYFSMNKFCWEWKIEQIQSEIDLGDNVLEFMTHKLLQLPSPTALVLKVASCMGMVIDVELLESVLTAIGSESTSLLAIRRRLQVAADESLISTNLDMTRFKFAHDQIRLATYNMLDSDHVRQKLHLKIGQHLQDTSEKRDNGGSDWKFLLAVDQLNRAEVLIQDEEVRVQLIQYNLLAAEKVMATSAFKSAAVFLQRGHSMLCDRRWEKHYELTLKLTSSLATVHFSSGLTEACLVLIDEIYTFARCREDKQLVQSLHVDALASANRLTECIAVGKQYLQDLGHPRLPKKPSPVHIVRGILGVHRALKDKTDEDILDLPICTNTTSLAAMRLFGTLLLAFFYAGLGSKYNAVTVCRMMQISLRDGINPWTPYALAGYAFTMTVSHNFDAASRFAGLSLKMMQRLRINDPRASLLVHGLVKHVQKPLIEGINPTLQTYKDAFSQGDMGFMGQACFSHCTIRYSAGVELQPLARDLKSFAAQLKRYNQVLMWKNLITLYWSVLKLIDQPGDLVESTGLIMHKNQMEQWLGGDKSQDMILFHFRIRAMASHFHCGDYDSALDFAEKSWSSKKEPVVAQPYLTQYFGISALIALDQWRKTRKLGYWKMFRKFRTKLTVWCKKGNPNGLHIVYMLQAEELAAKKGSKNDDVRAIFEKAISVSSRSGFVHDSALANVRCGKFFLTRNDHFWASHFLTRARELYKGWGATAAMMNLDYQHRGLLREEIFRGSKGTIGSSTLLYSSNEYSRSSIKGRSRKAEIDEAETKLRTPMLNMEE